MTTLEEVRAHCLALPEVGERVSHGHPWFFIREKKGFVCFHDGFHGDNRRTLWCAAPPGQQQGLITGSPDHYFRPAYVGHRGWIGVYLDADLAWDAVAGAIEEAYIHVAPAKLVDQLR